jgi:ABC-type Mn2+/Zn2+ transport system permease subunit
MSPGEIIASLFNEFPYAVYGSLMVGIACAFLGVHIVAKRVVFLGAVLTQVSVLGLALTFLPFVAVPHAIGSLAVTLGTVVIISRLLTGRKTPRDAVLGVVFVTSVTARLLIMQKSARVEVAEIENLLRGDILFVTPELFTMMLAGFVIAAGVYLLFFKEFTFVAFDPDTAAAQGYRARVWETVFYLMAGTVISLATHMVGDLFVFGFLVIPPVTALLLTQNVKAIVLISVLIGIIAPLIGLFVAFLLDVPASPAIVGVASVGLAAAWLWSVAVPRHT